ncbi:hypothetical protein GX48_07381 [Paracoccidioides brasiliensis]|nr:hypothetical protein GX48_07381 [Paracoccidioides brasiliensis]
MSDALKGRSKSGERDGGSVRRARERMEVGDRGIPPFEDLEKSRYPQKPPQGFSHPRRPPPVPVAFKSVDNTSKGAVISKPSPAPQWPLLDDRTGSRKGNSTSAESLDSSQRQAPQRPARPDNVPSLLDASKIHEYTPSMPYQKRPTPSSLQQTQNGKSMAQTRDERLTSSDSVFGLTDSGPPGSMPDFPAPGSQITQPSPAATGPPGRRNLNLRPPPSTRRTPSSHYSSTTFVSPIPEEFPESPPRKGGSYASSKVIPSSWGSAPPGADAQKSSDEESLHDVDDKPTVSLVRQASLGKRGKASLLTINKPQADQSANGNQDSKARSDKLVDGKQGTSPIGMAVSADANVVVVKDPTAILSNQSAPHYSDGHSASETSDDDECEKPPIPIMYFESKAPKPLLRETENDSFPALPESDQRKRPPQLDIAAVRRAEARGSLTSLPELIRRATRLASNLDRGKTASRLGMLDILNASNDNRSRNSGTISDILAAFPPPAIATPTGGEWWPGPFTDTEPRLRADAEKGPAKRKRLCCGIPLWAFILICIVALAVVAVAITIPVLLTVVNRPDPPRQSTMPASGSCQATNPCMNGGISVGDLGSCGCVCVNGFGGDRCDVTGDGSCTTINVSNGSAGFQNATLGNTLPRLFENSQRNFSIPLNASKILSLFSSGSVSCTSQNALVTFNGANRKRTVPLADGAFSNTGTRSSPLPTASHESIHGRGYQQDRLVGRQVASSPDTPTPASRSLTAPSAAPTRSSPSAHRLSPRLLDFSRIAVLFIFEQTGYVEDAIRAHDSIQSFFQDPAGESGSQMDSKGVNCTEHDFVLDFVKFSITVDNGTTVGGT